MEETKENLSRGLMHGRPVDKDGLLGEGVPFTRIRRITGYLVGDKNRFNNAKAKEVEDRVKHG